MFDIWRCTLVTGSCIPPNTHSRCQIRLQYWCVIYPPFLCVPDEQCRQGTGLDSSSCDVLKYMHTGFSMMQMAADTALMKVRRKVWQSFQFYLPISGDIGERGIKVTYLERNTKALQFALIVWIGTDVIKFCQ